MTSFYHIEQKDASAKNDKFRIGEAFSGVFLKPPFPHAPARLLSEAFAQTPAVLFYVSAAMNNAGKSGQNNLAVTSVPANPSAKETSP